MSERTAREGDRRELRFLLGAVGGMTVTAAGFVILVLALSVHVRDPVTEIPMAARSVVFYGGLLVLGLAYALRGAWPRRARGMAVVGAVAFVGAGSTAVAYRTGAPRISQFDRWLLGALSLVLLVGGAQLVRRAAREVGW